MENTELELDLRTLLKAAPDGIIVADEHGRILMVNEQLCLLFGYEDSAALVGEPIETLTPERLRSSHVQHRCDYTSRPRRRPMGLGLDLTGLRKDGSEFPVEISLSPVSSGGRTFAIATVRDISERRQLEAEREAMRTLLDTERERYRIGMDLHDGVMQDIYAVTLGLEMAFEDVAANPEQAQENVGRSIEQLQNVIRDIRSYIFDLRPRELGSDLPQALANLGREFQDNSSIATEVRVSPALPAVDHQAASALYVIAHEALSNTRKHAQASNVMISLYAKPNSVRLEVRDDGNGFDSSVELPEGHRGLRNMASRASSIGAEFSVENTLGKGTAILVDLPLT